MNKKKSKLIRLLPFVPVILTLLVSFIYAFNSANQNILFSPPNFSPNMVATNFAIAIFLVLVISTIFMLVVFYYLTKKGYY